MKKLKLPVPEDIPPSSRSLSMDEYLEFVLHHLKYTFNREEYEKQKLKYKLSVPFQLK